MAKNFTIDPKTLRGGIPKKLGSVSMPKRMSAPVTCGDMGSAPGAPPVRRVPSRARVKGLAG